MDKDKYSDFLDYKDIVNGEQCQVACPLHIDMPNYYNLMKEAKYEEAYTLLKAANPFPAITGRVCFFPCEYSCVRGRLDTPVAIREVEYSLSDYIQTGPNKRPELSLYKEGSIKGTKNESVAIIGSGPAGMVAAWDLAHFGYDVTIYEKESVCGGMAHLGIPVFKLLSDVIDYEINVLKQLGVKIETNVEVGKDISIDELKAKGVAAVCVAVGADVGNILRIPGEEGCENIYESTEILRQVRMGFREKLGQKVVIIGGGNTAMDISRTCKRLGATDVTIACRENKELMPAYSYEFEAAEREGIKFRFLSNPKNIETDGNKLTGLKCSEINADSLKDGNVTTKESSDFIIPADSIIRAISEKPNLSLLGENYAVAISNKGLIKQKMEQGLDALPGIFAAGDAISGPRSIVSAFASGRRAAISIDAYIRKTEVSPEKEYTIKTKTKAGVTSDYDELKRQTANKKTPVKVEHNFDLLVENFSDRQALEETNRCMRCNHTIEINAEECIACNYCVDACPVDCLAMVDENNTVFKHENDLKDGVKGSAVLKKDGLCIRCGVCIEICPVDVISFKCFDINKED